MATELVINCSHTTERIAGFIREQCHARRRDGVILGMSGGLDSSTAAALCVRSLGPRRVLGLILPEKEGDPQDVLDAREVAGVFGMRTLTHDMTEALRQIGAYRHLFSKVPTRPLRDRFARMARRLLRRRAGESGFTSAVKRVAGDVAGRELPYWLAKHRLRMVLVYFHAERENLMVVGCANRTERMTGLFGRFGVDDCADAMPIAHLYQTQIVRLARHLGVPERVVTKPPDTGLMAGVRDKYRHFFGLDPQILDAVLSGVDKGVAAKDLAATVGIETAYVTRIADVVNRSEGKLSPPAMLDVG
jgi:NAD+ synthase